MDDSISRQAALDALWKALFEYEDKTEKQFQESDELDLSEWMVHRIFVQNMSDIDRQTILNLPPAQPEVTEEAVKEYCRKRCLCIVDSALLKKYASAQPDCSDCIKHGGDWDCDHVHCHIGRLPSAQPKAGHWIEHEWAEEANGMLISNYECSECHRWERYNSDFCPNCGARMEEESWR